MDGHDAEDKDKSEPIFGIGDLIWTKVGKHPFWPCMVSYDPSDGNFIKFIKVRGKEQAIYHVQYFGESIQHGWTSRGSSFEFKGEEDFFVKTKTRLYKESSGFGPKRFKMLKDRYDVPGTSKGKWSFAVQEAEVALKVENANERFENYVFNYEKVKRKSSVLNGKKAKQKNPISNGEKAKRKSPLSNGTAAQCIESNDTLNESAPKRIRFVYTPQFCDVCDKDAAELLCTGICNKYFHKECVGLTTEPDNFKCAKCSSGWHSCFACKKTNGVLKECANTKCTKLYHAECLEEYACTNKDRHICPLHTCLTCYNENPRNIMSHKGNMVQCIQCPTAFHFRESCIAAGSVEKNSSTIICPYHFVGKQRVSALKTCNMNYCIICGSGGELVCCEACPNAFHRECLETEVPNEDFLCEDCINRRFLVYSMVVWSKIGKYRWWPAQIIHSSRLPANVKKMSHGNGEFAVQYFGTHDYSWVHSGRVFPYVKDHKRVRAVKNTKFYKEFKAGLREASEAFDEYQKNRLSESLLDKKPEAYKLIQVNRALPPAQILVDLAHISTCSCDPSTDNPCGPESQCLNRSMLMECHPDICLANQKCQNQKFQKGTMCLQKYSKQRTVDGVCKLFRM